MNIHSRELQWVIISVQPAKGMETASRGIYVVWGKRKTNI